MEISDKEVEHLAELASLELTDEQKVGLKKDIEGILGYIGMLNELNVDGVEPTYRPNDLKNVMRADEIVDYGAAREDLLELNEGENTNGMTNVPKVL